MSSAPLREIVEYYSNFAEETRLSTGSGQLEFERTKELLLRFLPPPPGRIIDVGGGAGAYAFWLARLGYTVRLIDATPRLAAEAARRNGTSEHPLAVIAIGDARQLPVADESADVVLLLGPLYHLTERADRIAALQQARGAVRTGGAIVVAGISRYAATLDGLAFHPALDSRLALMRHRSLASGQYRNDTNNPRYFVTAYFHRPDDLAEELTDGGLTDVRVFGIEGPGWLLPDFEARWGEPSLRDEILTVVRLLEEERSIIGASAHLLAVGVKRA
jgi:SAM-dependent methyltransferase